MAFGTTASLLLLAGAASAGAQVAGGFMANEAAKKNAKLQEQQAKIALDEANVAAEQKKTQQRKFLAEQRMAYLANGVSLVGTPGIVESDTFKEFQMEIDAIRKSGAARFGLGMKEAAITRSSGRTQLISGLFSGVSTLAQSGYYAKTVGKK